MCAGGEMKGFFIWHPTAFPPELVGTSGQTKGGCGAQTRPRPARLSVC